MRIPSFTAASITLYVLRVLIRNVSLSGRTRIAGIAAKWTTASYVRDAGTGLELVETGVGRERVEDLTRVGQVDAKVGDHVGMTERHQVAVDDPVSLLDEMRDGMSTCLAAAAGEEDAHGRSLRNHRPEPGRQPTGVHAPSASLDAIVASTNATPR